MQRRGLLFLILGLGLLAAPVAAQWATGVATQKIQADFDQPFTWTYSTDRSESGTQDVSACSTQGTVASATGDGVINFYSCSRANQARTDCTRIQGIASQAPFADQVVGTTGFILAEAVTAGVGGTVTVECRDVRNKTFDGTEWVETFGSAGPPGMVGNRGDDDTITFMKDQTILYGTLPAWPTKFYSADAGGALPEGSAANQPTCTRAAPCKLATNIVADLNAHDTIVVVDSDTWVDAADEMAGFVGMELLDTGCGTGADDDFTDEPCALLINVYAYDGVTSYTRTRFDCSNVPAITGVFRSSFLTLGGLGSGYFGIVGIESYRCPAEPSPGSTTSWNVSAGIPGHLGNGNLVTVNSGPIQFAGDHGHGYRLDNGNMVGINSISESRDSRAWDSDCPLGGECSANPCTGVGVPHAVCVQDGVEFRYANLQHPYEFNQGYGIWIGPDAVAVGPALGTINNNGPVAFLSDAGSGTGWPAGHIVLEADVTIGQAGVAWFSATPTPAVVGFSTNQSVAPAQNVYQYWRVARSRISGPVGTMPSGAYSVHYTVSSVDDGDADQVDSIFFLNTATGWNQIDRVNAQFAPDTVYITHRASIYDDLVGQVGNGEMKWFEQFGNSVGMVRIWWDVDMVYDRDDPGATGFDCHNINHRDVRAMLGFGGLTNFPPDGVRCSSAGGLQIINDGVQSSLFPVPFAGGSASVEGPGESGGVGVDGTAFDANLGCLAGTECEGLKGTATQLFQSTDAFLPTLVTGHDQVITEFLVGEQFTDAGAPPRS